MSGIQAHILLLDPDSTRRFERSRRWRELGLTVMTPPDAAACSQILARMEPLLALVAGAAHAQALESQLPATIARACIPGAGETAPAGWEILADDEKAIDAAVSARFASEITAARPEAGTRPKKAPARNGHSHGGHGHPGPGIH